MASSEGQQKNRELRLVLLPSYCFSSHLNLLGVLARLLLLYSSVFLALLAAINEGRLQLLVISVSRHANLDPASSVANGNRLRC